MTALPPGSTLGILGGGQLGRMLAMAAAQLGYETHIFAPEENAVAPQCANRFTCADYTDSAALAAFAESCDAITFEFENVPTRNLVILGKHAPLRPNVRALEIAQSRASEKHFVQGLGGVTAPFHTAESADDLRKGLEALDGRAIIKTDRLGYDGKGQLRDVSPQDASRAWDELGGSPVVVEGFVDFASEFSVILVRSLTGEIRFWPSAANNHKGGILATSIAPVPPQLDGQVEIARAISAKIAGALDYVGVLACEFFATESGPVFNEMAPRVHNSGHWSIEGAVTSQFENHVRAVCGLPMGDTSLVAPAVRMDNILGPDWSRWEEYLSEPANHLHLYGKHEAREGRKMGHVTRLLDRAP